MYDMSVFVEHNDRNTKHARSTTKNRARPVTRGATVKTRYFRVTRSCLPTTTPIIGQREPILPDAKTWLSQTALQMTLIASTCNTVTYIGVLWWFVAHGAKMKKDAK
jgi:hypothetical protein